MDDARVPIEWTLASIDEAKEELDHGDAAGAGRDAALARAGDAAHNDDDDPDALRAGAWRSNDHHQDQSTDARHETVLRMGSRVKSTRLAALTRAMSSRNSISGMPAKGTRSAKPLKVKRLSLTGGRSRRRLSLVDAPEDGALEAEPEEDTPDDDPSNQRESPSFERSVSRRKEAAQTCSRWGSGALASSWSNGICCVEARITVGLYSYLKLNRKNQAGVDMGL